MEVIMSADAWLTLLVVLCSLAALVSNRFPPESVLVAALTFLLLAGVLNTTQALAGFANPGLVTVAVLYVVVSGLVDTGAVQALGSRLLGKPRSTVGAQTRLMLPVMGLSAFLNNTPVVAMLVPVVEEWCRRHQLSVSKLMMPLSYAAILGGCCTLIGTSTNLIIHGLVLEQTSLGPMGFFEIAAVGVPLALLGFVYLITTQRWLLPERIPPLLRGNSVREYTIEFMVSAASPLIGKSVERAGLRHLPGVFLSGIWRSDNVIVAVSPQEVLLAGDRLVFVGAVESVVELVRQPGLVPAPENLFDLATPRSNRQLVEVVISATCPLIGHSIRDAKFRSQYEAVVIAVARNGERIEGRIGDIVLHTGDTLLLETRPAFVQLQQQNRDFLLVHPLLGEAVPRHDRAWLATSILLGMVVMAAAGWLSMLEAALLAGGAMLVTRCTSTASARASIDWSVLVMIGASLGLGSALEASGAASAIAVGGLSLVGDNPWLVLLVIYALTTVLTEVITNNAAAVLMFPIAQSAANSLDVSFWPFVVCLMMAASASFATPIGYQTNLMVYGPGGYRFSDYLRIGVPLNILLGLVTVLLAPLIWPFR
ncbi:Sodium-dependent dicarboxylate transporter SdcS [Halioglobus japonicus]|nr:Sodium-dependent dicarboxylate transporter SdcS [Halioglobus japonicus]